MLAIYCPVLGLVKGKEGTWKPSPAVSEPHVVIWHIEGSRCGLSAMGSRDETDFTVKAGGREILGPP